MVPTPKRRGGDAVGRVAKTIARDQGHHKVEDEIVLRVRSRPVVRRAGAALRAAFFDLGVFVRDVAIAISPENLQLLNVF